MSKIFPLIALLFVIFATPAFAHQGNSHKDGIEEEVEVEVECDAQGQWDNHGQYVSCFAHTKPGGAAVSAAAKSEVGKQSNGPSVTPAAVGPEHSRRATPTLALSEVEGPSASPIASPNVTPSPSPTVSPTPVVTPSPEASPTPEASLNPEASPSPEALTQNQQNILQDILERLNQLIGIINSLL